MKTAKTLPRPYAVEPLAQLGSPRLTLGLLPLLAIAVVVVSRDAGPASSTLAAPLGALAINLAAAIATRLAFRAQPALLAFHVALLVVVALAAAGRLTYLKGTVELSEGEEFAGALLTEESGPLHRRNLERAAFTNRGFTVDYEAGMRRARTWNRVSYRDGAGRERSQAIGDDTVLKLAGYRFQTTSNKGFAPELAWVPAQGGEAVRGTIHLPSYPAWLERQELAWSPPGSALVLHTRLEIEERIVDIEGRWRLRLPAKHALVVEAGGKRATVRPGESLRFAEGTLHYTGLRLWMGYTVSHDWTLPWLVSASVLAALALAWHFAARFRRESWRSQRTGGSA